MLDPKQVPDVEPEELLARLIIFSSHFRPSEQSVKPDAFIPYPRVDLSVTRHREASEDELWQEGLRVASTRPVKLYGRADVLAAAFAGVELQVEAMPLAANPNHADVGGWPSDKPAQKMKALLIANKSRFVPTT